MRYVRGEGDVGEGLGLQRRERVALRGPRPSWGERGEGPRERPERLTELCPREKAKGRGTKEFLLSKGQGTPELSLGLGTLLEPRAKDVELVWGGTAEGQRPVGQTRSRNQPLL